MYHYYVHYYRNFSNTYRLYYAAAGEMVPETLDRITRKEAFSLCRKERQRRRMDPNFSGFADTFIYPLSVEKLDIENRDWYIRASHPQDEYMILENEIVTYD